MSVRITINLPDELYAALRQRAEVEHAPVRSLIVDAINSGIGPCASRRVTGPLVGKVGEGPAPGSPDTENLYDVLFA